MPSRNARWFVLALPRRRGARLNFALLAGLLVLGATAAQALPLEVVTNSLANGIAGAAYSDAVQAASGTEPYGWTVVEGSLPGGIALDGGTGALSGTATLAGTSYFIVLVTDAVGDTATRPLSLTLAPAAASALSFTTTPSAVVAGATMTPAVEVKVEDAFGNAVAGELVSLALVGSGTLSGGAAVASDVDGLATFGGLSVDLAGSKQLTASSGVLTPVTSAAFTVSGAALASLSFQVEPSAVLTGAPITPAVQVRALDAFGNPLAGESVTLALIGAGTLAGGTAQLTDASGLATFSALTIDRAGSAQLSASAGAVGPVLSASFAVSCPAIGVSPTSLPVGSQGVAYSQTASASGGNAPHTFAVSAGALPGGLTLSSAGVISGSPTTGGSFGFTVAVTDANLCTGSRAYTIIVCAPYSVLPASLPLGQPGVAYSQSLSTSGGVAPYTFAVTTGALPPGLTLSGAGLLAGTPSATGVYGFTVTATASGGCVGSTAYTLTVPAIPAAVSDLAATRLTSGNDADGTARIQVSFTPTAFASSVEVYRAAFGGYPRYDDAGGLAPPTPSYPPGTPWVLTAISASGQTDEPVTRDAWSYVVFLKNALGQVSAVSNQTAGTTNYALGDVSDGVTAGSGDNLVNDLDLSLLGAHYGITGAAILGAGVSYLDVGPTVDLSVTTRPFTDSRIDFEDLVVFATNYGAVSAPAALIAAANAMARAATAAEELSVDAAARVEPGETFDAVVRMSAAGRVQGLSAELAWDAALVEPIAMTGSGWVESQHGVVWSARPGTFDAVLLGVRTRGLAGAGDLARVSFRARAAGDPAIRLARVLARDAANRPLGTGVLRFGAPAATPALTLLLAPAPNPARGATTLSFALATPGDAELAIYSVDGRRVRTLARGAFAAGTYRFTWQGDDELHHVAAPGIYFARLVTGGRHYSRTLVHLRSS